MSIPLRIIESPYDDDDWDGLQVGDMWHWPQYDIEGRECWLIVLPAISATIGRNIWKTTEAADRGQGAMWDVTGEPPNITVSPSINVVGDWHGWIRNGELVEA